VFMLDIAVSCL